MLAPKRFFKRPLFKHASRADLVCIGCSLLAGLLGILTIIGWCTGIGNLASVKVYYIPMAPSTATSFALLSFAIIARSCAGWPRIAATACSIAVGLVATVKLLEFIKGSSLGLDELFLTNPGTFGLVSKGRMAPITALNLFLAVLTLRCAMGRLRRYAGIGAASVTAISIIVLLGYLHGTPFLYGGSVIPVALSTAVAFFFIGCALLAAAGPECWPMQLFCGPSTSSLLLRWFLPVVIAGTILNDYLQIHFAKEAYFNPAMVSALATLTFALLVSAIISQVARLVGSRIDRAEADRYDAQRELEALNAGLEHRIAIRTSELENNNRVLQEVLSDLQKSHQELKRAQMQLIQLEKMQSVGSLAAGVAHEVKNPLAILEMGLGCLMNQRDLDAESLDLVHREMRDAVNRANTVISGMLDYSSSRELDIRSHDLRAVLEESLNLMRHELVSRQIAVVRDLSPDLPVCEIDAQKIEQVFINLFTNACHAMPRGGTLTIAAAVKSLAGSDARWEAGDRSGSRLREDERVIEIKVTDTGAGIPVNQLDKVFDPFFTTKPTGQGTGLGLSVSRKIIALHGGRLEMGNAPGGGAVATILLRLRQTIL